MRLKNNRGGGEAMAEKNVIKKSIFTVMAVLLLLLPVCVAAEYYEEEEEYENEQEYDSEQTDYEEYIETESEYGEEQPEEESEFLEEGSVASQAKTADSLTYDTGDIRAAICAVAIKQLGISYVPGGDTPQAGFDCSGLIQYAFYQNGIKLPRYSRSQFASGDEVKLSDIQPGDVVFFQVYSKGELGQGAVLNKVTEYVKTNPTHVGIYMGGGIFIHAPSRGQTVKKSDLKSRFWRSHLIGIRDYTSRQVWEASETTGVSVNTDALLTDTAKAAKKAVKLFGKAADAYKDIKKKIK